MVLVKAKPKKQHQRHHMHHRLSQQYAKVYYPYLPVIALLIGFSIWGFLAPRHMQQTVLGKATSLSSQDLLESTNAARSKNSQPPLKLNSSLSQAAQSKAQDMVVRNYWSHNAPDGTPPWSFIDATSYTYQKAGENLAYGFVDSETTVRAWMLSPGHRANILDNSYQEVGFGYYDSENFNGSGPSTIVVAMYGRPLLAEPMAASSNSPGNQGRYLSPSTQVASSQLDSQPMGSSIAQLISGKGAALMPLAILFMSVALGFWAGSHIKQIKRIITQGQSLVMHHPIYDMVAIGMILIVIILSQTLVYVQ